MNLERHDEAIRSTESLWNGKMCFNNLFQVGNWNSICRNQSNEYFEVKRRVKERSLQISVSMKCGTIDKNMEVIQFVPSSLLLTYPSVVFCAPSVLSRRYYCAHFHVTAWLFLIVCWRVNTVQVCSLFLLDYNNIAEASSSVSLSLCVDASCSQWSVSRLAKLSIVALILSSRNRLPFILFSETFHLFSKTTFCWRSVWLLPWIRSHLRQLIV